MGFAAIHVFIGRLRFLDVVPRSRWLSFAGGVAVAYVFLHVLPELSGHRETFAEALELSEKAAEALAYTVALAGLVSFYGLERAVKSSRGASAEARVGSELLWLHVGAFAVYNGLIGYLLLHREESGVSRLVVYAVAMALHFVTTDYGLRQDQKKKYDASGRWVLAGAVLLGWMLGVVVAVPRTGLGFLLAFLAGGVVLNVLKEELPEERQSRFWPFALGGASCGILLVLA